ncbi:MAG: L-seryl-tRNA(Sec) selenium transferase [Candidatus Acidiferrales bacterium]
MPPFRAMCSNVCSMKLPSDSSATGQANAAGQLREIPSVDALLLRPRLQGAIRDAGQPLVAETTRKVLAALRARMKTDDREETESTGIADIEAAVLSEIAAALAPSLRPVINATGVVLHTNLGRAPLSGAAAERILSTATRYSNLEYDLETGRRGKRDTHTSALLAELAGAEAAIVVNNNAAAVFLVLHTLAKGAEVVVSRGELIEIGDGFRIPDIMAESGAILREVGTTNRTRIADYELAIGEETRLLLRVHPSNFRIAGFTERPSLDELVALGRRFDLPVFEDLGSGCLADLASSGMAEPQVRASCEAGATVVTFSGDKLLGGPQAGIIAGKKEIIARIRRNPLFRTLRVDKLTSAALEATLAAYRRGALDDIPALRMIRLSRAALALRAADFIERLRSQLPADVSVAQFAGFSVVGGGSTPDQQLPAELIAVTSHSRSAAALEERLRRPAAGSAVIARIADGRLLLDLRTVFPDEEPALASALAAALR